MKPGGSAARRASSAAPTAVACGLFWGSATDELPADQLDRVALERAEIDKPLVLDAPPALQGQRDLRHAPRLRDRNRSVNADGWIRGQPLTEPAVRPCTMYFWKISTSRTAGSAPRKPEAAITE